MRKARSPEIVLTLQGRLGLDAAAQALVLGRAEKAKNHFRDRGAPRLRR